MADRVAVGRRATVLACVAIAWAIGGCARQSAAPVDPPDSELASLRTGLADAAAQNSIRGLMHAYGRLIDAREWDEFAKLWTDDATYVGGSGDALRGGPAIAGFLRDILTANPSGVGEPNFHVFFNEEITVTGESARATSMSTFVTPGATGRPSMVMLARYEDTYVLREGQWKFQSRVVQGKLPAPRPKTK